MGPGDVEAGTSGDGLKITQGGDHTIEVKPNYSFSVQGPTLYIKTPNGVTLCPACNEWAVTEYWTYVEKVDKRLGLKCMWCGVWPEKVR